MKNIHDDPKILAFALDELEAPERDEIAAQIEADAELRQLVNEYRQLGDRLRDGLNADPPLGLTADQKDAIKAALHAKPARPLLMIWSFRVAAVALLGIAAWIGAQVFQDVRQNPTPTHQEDYKKDWLESGVPAAEALPVVIEAETDVRESVELSADSRLAKIDISRDKRVMQDASPVPPPAPLLSRDAMKEESDVVTDLHKTMRTEGKVLKSSEHARPPEQRARSVQREQVERAAVEPDDQKGATFAARSTIPQLRAMEERAATQSSSPGPPSANLALARAFDIPQDAKDNFDTLPLGGGASGNPFISTRTSPLTALPMKADATGYVLVRELLNSARLPLPDQVQIEELVNYFDYDYPLPFGPDPLAVHMEVASCPWNPKHRLVRIGMKGKGELNKQRPVANLVFLLDVSKSMNAPEKMPLVMDAIKKMLPRLRSTDKIAIVADNGGNGLVLAATSGDQRQQILEALGNLRVDGRYGGTSGTLLAFELAQKNYMEGGSNHVIIGTDDEQTLDLMELGRLTETAGVREVGLSILNLDRSGAKADGPENPSPTVKWSRYLIKNLAEAEKVLLRIIGESTNAIARNAVVQVHFNTDNVSSYRLIGYDGHSSDISSSLKSREDGIEIETGAKFTVLYELLPSEAADLVAADSVGGTAAATALPAMRQGKEILTVRLHYSDPDTGVRRTLNVPMDDHGKDIMAASADFKFTAAVAAFGMILRHPENHAFINEASILKLANDGLQLDLEGERNEFIELVKKAKELRN